MITIVPLVGKSDSGKTKTILAFFGHDPNGRISPNIIYTRVVDGKQVYCIGVASVQELSFRRKREKKFSDEEWVQYLIERIELKINRCRRECKCSDFILITPFTVFKDRRGNIRTYLIDGPINHFRSIGHDIHIVTLLKASDTEQYLADLGEQVIKSKMEWQRQANELEAFIQKII